MSNLINPLSIELIISDFDGVMTNNKVYVNSDGNEFVQCDRSDGLAINFLHSINLPVFVLSSERNQVVKARCDKLNIRCIHGSKDKALDVKTISQDLNVELSRIAFIGNDINDIPGMRLCGHRICPSDSHPLVKDISTLILQSRGGDGVLREFAEYMGMLDKL